MMKAHPYSFLTLILITLAFLFSDQAMAADIDATLPDSNNTSSFQVKNPESTNNILMKVQSGGNVGIGTASPDEKLDVNGNVQISGANGKLVLPASHYDVKIELFKGGDEKIGTSDNQLKLIAGSGETDNIAFFGDSAEVMRVETGSGNVGIGTTSPKATLHVDGSIAVRYSPVSFASGGTYPVQDRDMIIGITALGATGTINLPSATSENVGRIITIKNETNVGGSTTQLVVAPASGDTINDLIVDNPGYLLAWGFVRLYSNGSNHWLVIGGELASGF